jgi:hypothetical protein
MTRRTVLEEEQVGQEMIYRTSDGWFVRGLPCRPVDRETARTLAELRRESRLLALINAGIVELGGAPIPPRPSRSVKRT